MPVLDLHPLNATATDRVVVAAAWDGDGSPGLPDGWTLFGSSGRAAVVYRTGAPTSIDIPYTGDLDAYGIVALRIDGSVSASSFPLSWPDPDVWCVATAEPGSGSVTLGMVPKAQTEDPNSPGSPDPDAPDTPRPPFPTGLRGGIIIARQDRYLAVAAARADSTEVVKARLGVGSVPRAVLTCLAVNEAPGRKLDLGLVWSGDLPVLTGLTSSRSWAIDVRCTSAAHGPGLAEGDWLLGLFVKRSG